MTALKLHSVPNGLNRQRGYGLIEMLLVVTAIIIMISLMIGAYSRFTERQKTSQTVDDFNALVAAVQSLYGNRSSYVGINTAMVIGGVRLPTEMVDTVNNQLVYPWGTITLASAGVNNNQFTVTYNADPGMPEKVCVSVVSNIQPVVDAVTVGGQPINVIPDDAVANCAGGGQAIVFTLR